MQNNIRSLALASLCWIATLIVSIITNIYFIAALRKLKRQIRIMQTNQVYPDEYTPRKVGGQAW